MANFDISYRYSLKDAFSRGMRRINVQVKKNTRQLKKHTQQLKNGISSIKTFIRKYRMLGLVAAAAFTAAVISASKFQAGLTDILNLLDQKTINKFSGDLNKAQESAVKMGFGVADVNKALFDTVSAIGNVDKSLDIFNVSQKLAIGGATDLSTAVDGLTSVVNAYGKEQTDATSVANAFFAAQKAGKTTVALLAQNVGKVAPIAKQAGVSFEQLLASMSQLTLGGLSTEEASTALRGAIAGLLKPTDTAAKIFRKYNIPIGASALQSSNFTDVLQKLAIVAEKSPDSLAEMIPNIRALTAISALGATEVGNLKNIIKSMDEDALTPAFNRKLSDFNTQWKQTLGLITVVAKRFGDMLLPILTKVLMIINKLLDAFTKLKKADIAKGAKLGGIFAPAIGIVKDALGIKDKGDQLLDNTAIDKGTFDANININAPKGTVSNVKTKEKKASGFNLGLNMQEA